MRGALIGYGVIAGGHHDAYDQVDGLDLVAVVDGNAERRAAAERRDPSLSVYASMAELFAAEKLDFVDICTPPGSHLKLMLAALDQGCHVLCEKPFLLLELGRHLSTGILKLQRRVSSGHIHRVEHSGLQAHLCSCVGELHSIVGPGHVHRLGRIKLAGKLNTRVWYVRLRLRSCHVRHLPRTKLNGRVGPRVGELHRGLRICHIRRVARAKQLDINVIGVVAIGLQWQRILINRCERSAHSAT